MDGASGKWKSQTQICALIYTAKQMRFGVGPIVRDESIENQISDCILPWGEKRERKKERKKESKKKGVRGEREPMF